MHRSEDIAIIVRSVLRPLVSFCLKRGLRFKDCEEILKSVFVEQAQEQIRQAGGDVSVSKVSVATGIHRTEVTRLASGEAKPTAQHDLLHRIIGMWTQSKRFRTPSGSPKALSFEGTSSDFAKLVASVSLDLTPYPVLFELERLGAIRYEGDTVKLVVAEYIPIGDPEHGFGVVSKDIADLITAAESNVYGGSEQPILHLRTFYDNVSQDALPHIRAWLLERGAKLHEEAREYLSQFDCDLNAELDPRGGGAHVAVTSFGVAEVPTTAPMVKPKKRGRKKADDSK